ncbi:heavy-metal-associated domain-containing protein [Alkalilimnicola sp. S0819]|uniref:heavy-metal-associated domain-containing protein n=1 Tax=Alkalilimnicola sp. S0819 TaxID=2613922 RepID=UPI001261C308|nr:heavy metal-associated domain-containing protein [Alkalilimnicola sp. S0819]KAB7627484.1 heavy-metal-associated domain-containing protein [Alkalilimnicola sp. S0819]MPQ15636.1 hypothetical protein [Alkalilimnicola sp. S0819]
MELLIKGMSCGHCERAVEKVPAAQPGVRAVQEVSASRGIARLEGDAAPEALAHALRVEGYELVASHG